MEFLVLGGDFWFLIRVTTAHKYFTKQKAIKCHKRPDFSEDKKKARRRPVARSGPHLLVLYTRESKRAIARGLNTRMYDPH